MPTRILVADDSPPVRAAMRQLLEGIEGWQIFEAENGKEAVVKAQEIRPSLIILDLAMPVMDGLTASREITRLLPAIPILVHTLHGSPQIEVELRNMGVRKMIAKSDSNALISAVRELLSSEATARFATPEPI